MLKRQIMGALRRSESDEENESERGRGGKSDV
jgi:hypothetical protein